MVLSPEPLAGPLSLEVPGHRLTGPAPALGGQRAALPLACAPRPNEALELTLRWPGGSATHLVARVAAVDDGGLTHVDVVGVAGDWRPWLAWLGHRAAGAQPTTTRW
jgi:hypothetical protein